MIELLQDNHFWVGVALITLLAILGFVGVHKTLWKALGDAGDRVQAQLDEADKLRAEAQTLLSQIQTQRAEAERAASEMLANAKSEAKRLEAEAKDKLAEQIKRRGELAERKIATAEAQATADVRAAAADLAAQMAEQVLVARAAGAKTDPLIDAAIGQLGSKLQ